MQPYFESSRHEIKSRTKGAIPSISSTPCPSDPQAQKYSVSLLVRLETLLDNLAEVTDRLRTSTNYITTSRGPCVNIGVEKNMVNTVGQKPLDGVFVLGLESRLNALQDHIQALEAIAYDLEGF